MKISPAQYRALRSAEDHGDAGRHIRGRSEAGGLYSTCASLRRAGLLDSQNRITDAGRRSRRQHEAKTK